MPLKVVILTQHAPLYIGPFFDHWLKRIDSNQFELVSIVAFSPIFKSSGFEELKARFAMYGLASFIKMSLLILKEKLKAKCYEVFKLGKCASIKNISQKYKIPILEFSSPNSDSFQEYCRSEKIDLLISIACPKILKAPILNLPPKGTLNYHTGGLPKYRGRQPLFWAKYHREKKIGITVHEMAESLDAGAILSQHWVENSDDLSLHQLYLKTIEVGPQVLIDAMNKLAQGDTDRLENPDELATKFSFPNEKEGRAYRKMGLKYI